MACGHVSGSGFTTNTLNFSRPLTRIKSREKTNYVSLTVWCQNNFISKNIGRSLIKKKLLIAQRLHHQWWVCANPDCLEELLDYLGVEELNFDAENDY